MNPLDREIRELAEAAGIAVDWTDAYDKPQQVGPDTLRTILEALGYPCATDEQCRDSRAKLAAEEQSAGALPPLLTLDANKPFALPMQQGLQGRRYVLEFEDGGRFEGSFGTGAASGAGHASELPPISRIGYHRLTVDGAGTATLAVAPPRCFCVNDAAAVGAGKPDARLWGLAVQLYGLRREGDLGIGDFSALTALVKSAAAHGASAVAISPTHAMFSADRNRYSPYGPSSRLFQNVLHIDPAAVLGPAALAKALAELDVTGKEFEKQPLVDWPAAASLRLDVLRILYRQFMASGVASQQDFEEFRAHGGEALADHARFEALQAWLIGQGQESDWRRWPAQYRDPRNPAVEAFAAAHEDEVGFHAFLQWQAARGLAAAQCAARDAGMPIGLIADLAVGAETGGSQAWSRQEEMINGLSIGAPPDLLNARGQSWGLGAFSPRAMKRKGFRAYIEMLRAAFANAGGVRIDHVLGLGRMWLVPDGAPATEGAYLRFPIADLLRLIALESWRHRAIVIGEDLGTVPPGFDKILGGAGLLGIRVLQFQRDWKRADADAGTRAPFLQPALWSADAIATTATHDTPTMAGWWEGRDIDWRTKLDLLEAGATEDGERQQRAADRALLWQAMTEAGCASGDMPPAAAQSAPLHEMLAFIGKTPAPLAILPLEDALGLAEQPNVPGTVETHPNWRRRMPAPAGVMLDEPAVAQRLAALHAARKTR